jgi:hypothetical protein
MTQKRSTTVRSAGETEISAISLRSVSTKGPFAASTGTTAAAAAVIALNGTYYLKHTRDDLECDGED